MLGEILVIELSHRPECIIQIITKPNHGIQLFNLVISDKRIATPGRNPHMQMGQKAVYVKEVLLRMS